jgi:hypothetical protein
VSAETSRRLACDASRVVMRHDADGRVLEVGARTRTIPPPCGAPSSIAIAPAASPAAARASLSAITSITGRMAAPPRSRTSPFAVAGTTGLSTRTPTSWSGSPTANSNSGDRTAGSCPTSRRLRRCPPSSSPVFTNGMQPRVCASTPARPAQPGWANASIWAMRSTSCTRWRGEKDRIRHREGRPPLDFAQPNLTVRYSASRAWPRLPTSVGWKCRSARPDPS